MMFVDMIVMVVIVIIGFGGALMTFPAVRQVGASLLASAGVAGTATSRPGTCKNIGSKQ